MIRFYRYFLDGIPVYLARHYWWAYLWPKAVWFFDHQPIINAILFGQYKKLMNTTLDRLEHAPRDRVLQLTCVYGSLTPSLIQKLSPVPLHITDVASVQLKLARSKAEQKAELVVTRMNAEQLVRCPISLFLETGNLSYPEFALKYMIKSRQLTSNIFIVSNDILDEAIALQQG